MIPSSAEADKRWVAGQPSETALATATMRALAAHDPREEIRGPDFMAELFLSEDRKRPLQDPAAREWVMKNKITPGAYEFMIARTAFFDHIVEEALRGKVPQIVFLGAGYDTRPYRFRDLLGEARIFELDAEPTQKRKQELLQEAGLRVPEQVAFIPIDFETDDLGEVLHRAGLRRGLLSLFVWEGVTYYLSARGVDDTLSRIRSNSPAGSSLGFDYACLSAGALEDDRVKRLREVLSSDHPAEATRYGIAEGTIEEFLRQRGYRILEHLAPAEMERKYLTLRDGSTVGKVPPLFRLVHAAV